MRRPRVRATGGAPSRNARSLEQHGRVLRQEAQPGRVEVARWAGTTAGRTRVPGSGAVVAARAGALVGRGAVLRRGGDVEVAVRQRQDLARLRARPGAAPARRSRPRWSPPGPSGPRGRRLRRRRASASGVALGPGEPSSSLALVGRLRCRRPSERGGLPAASARTASGTAGSTSQVIGRDPAEAPKSTSERSRPPGESVPGPAGDVGRGGRRGRTVIASAQRDDQRGVHLAAVRPAARGGGRCGPGRRRRRRGPPGRRPSACTPNQ